MGAAGFGVDSSSTGPKRLACLTRCFPPKRSCSTASTQAALLLLLHRQLPSRAHSEIPIPLAEQEDWCARFLTEGEGGVLGLALPAQVNRVIREGHSQEIPGIHHRQLQHR